MPVTVTVGVLLQTPPCTVTAGGRVLVLRIAQSGWGPQVPVNGGQVGLALVTVLV